MDLSSLPRRERQIVQIVYASGGATVNEICDQLPDPPTPMAARRMLAILLEKGLLKRRKQGREFVYLPKQSKQQVGAKALKDVLHTFFDGSIGQALATHLNSGKRSLSKDEVLQLNELIETLTENQGDES